MEIQPRKFDNAADAAIFALAGNAYFTLRSTATGARYTYRVAACKDNVSLFFISVLTGSDNTGDYTYLGTIRRGQATVAGDAVYAHGRKSKISEDAPSAKAFAWSWRHLIEKREIPVALEMWHEARCGRCGRMLTVPESVARGIGPECASIICEAA